MSRAIADGLKAAALRYRWSERSDGGFRLVDVEGGAG